MATRYVLRTLASVGAPFAIALGAFVVFELVVHPAPEERPAVLAVFIAVAGGTAIAGWILPRLTVRLDSLLRMVLFVAIASMATTAAAVAIWAYVFMRSPAELSALLVVLGFGVAAGLVLETTVARSLAGDVQQLRAAATRIAAGNLSARTHLDRLDEVGQAGRAIDIMASRLQRMEEDRGRADKAREAFLAGVGHDLRTPLAALRAAVEALEDGLAPDPARYFAAIHRNLAALQSLVDDLFILARIEAGALEFPRAPVDLAEVADEAVEALTPTARQRNVVLRLQAASQVVVLGGSAELSRAIRNLLDNAIRHAPPGTEVLIEVTDGDRGVVRVVDQGDGLPENLPADLIDGYERLDAIPTHDGRGTGLGLVITKGIAEAHGGGMGAEAGPGGRVWFWIPWSRGAEPTAGADGGSADVPQQVTTSISPSARI